MSIAIGSCQLLEAAWAKDYFPEDLPSEWRLVYYANDYPIVLFNEAAWIQNAELDGLDWPDSLRAAFEITSIERLDRIKCLSIHDEQAVFLSAEIDVCQSLAQSGFRCLLWNKVSADEYRTMGERGDEPVIRLLRDAGGDLKQMRKKLELYSLDDAENWVFLDSLPARLEQIKLMLDLMGIRA